MCNETNEQTNCLANIFESILMLQQKKLEGCEDNTCTRPFLGPSLDTLCYNTRPINIYTCCNNTLWTMPYTLNGVEGESTVFRLENMDDNSITCRVLSINPDTESTFPYLSTEDFFTIKLSCIGAVKCLGDTNITGI